MSHDYSINESGREALESIEKDNSIEESGRELPENVENNHSIEEWGVSGLVQHEAISLPCTVFVCVGG